MYSIPPDELDEFNRLPQTVRDNVRRRLAAFARAAAFMSGGISQAKALQAVSSKDGGLTFGTLKRHFPVYKKEGDWRVLTDGRHESAPQANRDLTAWARALASANKRGTGRASAWRAGIRELVSGKRIPGYGTWQEIWRRENPGQPTPAVCPFSELRGSQPKKLSSRNFYRLAATPKAQRALALSGTAAARSALSGLIEFDTSKLRPLEMIAFDDVRADFMILDPVTGRVEELWMLVAMDVGTRCELRFGIRPRRLVDGKHEGITRRDMQHLVCGILREYGYPADYDCTLLVENASAAITSGFEAALAHNTGGRVRVKRTPVLKGNPFMDGWGEEGRGNPKGKSWREAAFRLMHEEAGAIAGQIGADYSLKSASHSPAQRFTEKMIRQATPALTLTQRHQYGLPFETLQQGTMELEEIFIRMNARRNHNLTGFDLITEWRWKESPVWRPWDQAPKGLPPEAWESIETRRLPESPWMRLTRLVEGVKFSRVADSSMSELLADHVVTTYGGGSILTFQYNKKSYRFDVADHPLTEGEPVTCYFDADRLEEGIFITVAGGRSLGHAPRTNRVEIGNQEQMAIALKRKGKIYGEALKNLRLDTLTEDVWDARATAADQNLETVELARAILPAPVEAAGALPARGSRKRPAAAINSFDADDFLTAKLSKS